MGTPTLELSFLHPVNRQTAQQRFLSLSLSLLSFTLCNPSLRSQLQTKRSFPSRHLNKSIHSTSHANQISQVTNGRASRTVRSLYKKRPRFQPEIIPYLNELQQWLSEPRIAINVSKSTAIIFVCAGQRFIQP